MKNIIKFLGVFTFLIGTSCTDLDVDPKNIAAADLVLSTPEAYKAYLAKLYAGLAITGQTGPAGNADITGIDEGESQYIRAYWCLQELSTDEAVIGWGDEGIQDFHAHNWTSQNRFITAAYYRVFYQVSLANEFLRETTPEKIAERGLSEDVAADIQAYRAEARVLRALSYWHGLDFFRNTILVTENDPLGSVKPQQSTPRAVFDYIESELLAVEEELAEPRQNEFGRADKAVAWMILAKLYLNAEVYVGEDRYSDAVTYLDKVIGAGFALDDTYQNLFNLENENSSEIIFRVNFDGQRTRTYGGMTFLMFSSRGGSMDFASYGMNGGWGGTRTTSALVDQFPDETGAIDSRAIFYTNGQTKEITNISNFTDGYAVPKFSNVDADGNPGSDLQFPDTDFPMFRLADAYLMYAEAVLRGGAGNLGLAVGYINELRERAYGDNSGNITSDELTLDFILDERARELYWEGHRRTDLVRFNQFTENGIWPWKGNVAAGVTTAPFRNIYPIPSSEIIANPNLDQNDEY